MKGSGSGRPSRAWHGSELVSEARRVHAVLECAATVPHMDDAQLVAAFVLAWVSLRSRRWLCGKLAEPGAPLRADRHTVRFRDVPPLLELCEEQLAIVGLGDHDTALLEVFRVHRLVGLKHGGVHVNEGLLQWHHGVAPFVLMDRLPTPLEVLQQQARRSRVITMFRRLDELAVVHASPLMYFDAGEGLAHRKDAFELLTHDMQHMRLFIDPQIHAEQVGFFRCVERVGNGDLYGFFRALGLDEDFLHQLDYCVSDMNAFALHCVQYLVAKLIAAHQRATEAGTVTCDVEALWTRVVDAMGVAGDARDLTIAMAARKLVTVDERECVRGFFIAAGQ